MIKHCSTPSHELNPIKCPVCINNTKSFTWLEYVAWLESFCVIIQNLFVHFPKNGKISFLENKYWAHASSKDGLITWISEIISNKQPFFRRTEPARYGLQKNNNKIKCWKSI